MLSSLLVSDMYILFKARNSLYIEELGIIGAVLMDLIIKRKTEINGSRINLIDTTATGDSYLDWALSIISEFETNKKISFYIKKLLKRREDLYQLFAEHLESLNLVNLSVKKIRFTPTFDFTVLNFNNDLSEEIFNMVKKVLLQNNAVPDTTFMYFLSILQGTLVYKKILGKENKKQVKYRMKDLSIDEPIGKKVHKAVFAADAD